MYNASELVIGDILLMTQSPVVKPGLSKDLDRIVKWATVDPYEHAALVVCHPNGELMIAEALLHVEWSPLDKYAVNGHRFHVPLTGDQPERLSQAAQSRIGQFYGWEMLFEDAVRDILHIDWAPPLKARQLDCSAFVVWCFLQTGICLTYRPAPAPADIAYSPVPIGPRLWKTT